MKKAKKVEEVLDAEVKELKELSEVPEEEEAVEAEVVTEEKKPSKGRKALVIAGAIGGVALAMILGALGMKAANDPYDGLDSMNRWDGDTDEDDSNEEDEGTDSDESSEKDSD